VSSKLRRPGRRRLRGQGGGRRIWTPASFGSSLIAWYRGDEYAAGTWIDKSAGVGPNLAQATPANQGTLVVEAGQLGVLHNGAQFSLGDIGVNVPQPISVLAVFRPIGLGTAFVLAGDGGAAAISFGILAGPNWFMNGGSQIMGGVPTAAIHGFVGVFDGASSFGWVDDVRDGQHVMSGHVGMSGTDGITIAAQFNGGSGFNGVVSEIALVAGVVSAADRGRFAKYSNRYSGLSMVA
jgi:hypothetical protein